MEAPISTKLWIFCDCHRSGFTQNKYVAKVCICHWKPLPETMVSCLDRWLLGRLDSWQAAKVQEKGICSSETNMPWMFCLMKRTSMTRSKLHSKILHEKMLIKSPFCAPTFPPNHLKFSYPAILRILLIYNIYIYIPLNLAGKGIFTRSKSLPTVSMSCSHRLRCSQGRSASPSCASKRTAQSQAKRKELQTWETKTGENFKTRLPNFWQLKKPLFEKGISSNNFKYEKSWNT